MKSQSLLASWVCLVAMIGSTTGAIADEGLDDYRQGRYAEAAKQLLQDNSNNPIVDYYMGRMRLYGYGQLKNNTIAIRYLTRAAEKGVFDAQQLLARYELFEKNNPEGAFSWFKKSADANDVKSQMYCAAAYLFGVGVKKNPELARRYYLEAAKSGDAIAQYTLAENFLESRQSESKKLGLLWLEKAVAQNNPAAQVRLGELYANGSLVPVDLEKAKELIKLAVQQGYVPAFYQMGELMLKQNQLPEAKEWFTKAANLHAGPAELALAHLHSDPKSQFYNPRTAFLGLLKSAQNINAEAALALASMYQEGHGVEKNEHLAEEWKQKAILFAKDSPMKAENLAAQWLTNGKAIKFASTDYHQRGILSNWYNPDGLKENNYNPAPQMQPFSRQALYQPKFEMTNPNEIPISEYYDALAAGLGGVSRQEQMSFPRYQLADLAIKPQKIVEPGIYPNSFQYIQGRAVLGDTAAQFRLSQMYQDGIGVNKNTQEAIKYYELAAAQQELRAEYNLAMIYLEGKDVKPDYAKAVTLLRDAAFKGNDYAQYALALINERGYRNPAGEEVIVPDREQATAMYYLAAANDLGLAQYRLAELLVREKDKDMSVLAKQKRNQMVKQLYEDAAKAGVAQARLPLAYFNAMDSDKSKQIQAFEVAKREATTGNAGASLLLGLLYDRGIGVEANQNEAIDWYQKAGINPVSAYILGTYYSKGIHFSRDTKKGSELLQQSADAGFPYANLNLAIIKYEREEPFLPELDKALAAGNSTAGILLADYYLSKASDESHMKQARDIYQRLAEKGDKDAQLKLGFMYERGFGGDVDVASAEKWYRRSAEQGQPVGQYLLGRFYQLGKMIAEPDNVQAKKWFSSAESNYAPAAVALGFLAETVDDDYQQALNAYQLAADKQDPVGQFNLGLLFEKGKGVPVDLMKAKTLYQAASLQGHSQAMVQLAGLYFSDVTGPRDESEALNWYKKAAELGNRDALYQLGLLSETGVATQLDALSALHYYQQAAEKGNAKAILALARMYQYGLGVAKNHQQALKLYQELAALGNAYAQYQLATFFFEGVDGKRMPVQGKQLLQQAEMNGSYQARKILQWLDAQAQERTSFIEPAVLDATTSAATEQPVDLMYMDALNDWNRGDELSSRMLLDRIMIQFPHYIPARRAYEQLNQEMISASIFG